MTDPLSSGPFGDGSVDLFRQPVQSPGLDPYRTYFVAQITDRALTGGVWLYSWREQTFDGATGALGDANPRREGTATVSPALETNNARVDAGAFVFMRQKGVVKGQIYYEFDYGPGGAATDADGNPTCSGLDWLALLRPSDCLELALTYDPPAESGSPPPAVTQTVSLAWDADAEVFTSDVLITVCDVDYTVTLDPDTEELALTGPLPDGGGQPFAYTRRATCGACSYAVFGFSRLKLCPCAEPEAEWCDNLIRIRIERAAACATSTYTCGEVTYTTAARQYIRFAGELAWLGCVEGAISGLTIPLRDASGAAVADAQVTAAYVINFGCYAVLHVGFRVGPDAFEWQSLGAAPTDFAPFSFTDALTVPNPPPPQLVSLGYTSGGASATLTDTPCGEGVIPGYTGPGWYVTNQGVLYLDDESPELCLPTTVIVCGPYATEAAANAAIADGSCFPEDCVSIPGWGGAGWYCVEVSGGSGGPTCEPLELLDADRCDPTVTICSGPYADEAAATAACGDAEPPHGEYACVDGACVEAVGGDYPTLASCQAACGTTCCAGTLPGDIAAAIGASVAGPVGAACAAGTATGGLTDGTGTFNYTGAVGASGGPVGSLQVICDAGTWYFLYLLDAGAGGAAGTASGGLTDDGMGSLVGTGTLSGPCGGTVTVSVSNPCP